MIDLPLGIVLANVVVALATFIQASSGIGFAMIAVPLLALIDLSYVPGPSLFAMLGLSITMAWSARRAIDRQGLASLIPGLAIGTLIGALALGAIPASAVSLVFGTMVLLGLLSSEVGLVRGPSPLGYSLAGVIAGLMGTMAGIHGPALAVIYRRVDMRTARATIALIFVIASVMSLLSLHRNGLFGEAEIRAGLWLIPGLVAGYGFARGMERSITDRVARCLMVWLAGSSALGLIAKSLWPMIMQE